MFRLAFVHAERVLGFTLIGADGGLLARPLGVEEAFLGPGERLDVLLDLRGVPPRDEVVLRSLDFDPMRDALAELCRSPGPAGSAAGAPAATQPNASAETAIDGTALDLLRIRVQAGPAYARSIPPRLSQLPALDARRAHVRDFLLDHERMRWAINGARFDMLRTQLSV